MKYQNSNIDNEKEIELLTKSYNQNEMAIIILICLDSIQVKNKLIDELKNGNES